VPRSLTKVDVSYPVMIIAIPPFAMIERINTEDKKEETCLTGLPLIVASLRTRIDALFHFLFSMMTEGIS
jgi:hypothetical protein